MHTRFEPGEDWTDTTNISSPLDSRTHADDVVIKDNDTSRIISRILAKSF